jgi:hypothetical protein
MGCAWENSRGECRWKKGFPAPCQLEDMDEEERERAEYFMERDYDMEDDDE